MTNDCEIHDKTIRATYLCIRKRHRFVLFPMFLSSQSNPRRLPTAPFSCTALLLLSVASIGEIFESCVCLYSCDPGQQFWANRLSGK